MNVALVNVAEDCYVEHVVPGKKVLGCLEWPKNEMWGEARLGAR